MRSFISWKVLGQKPVFLIVLDRLTRILMIIFRMVSGLPSQYMLHMHPCILLSGPRILARKMWTE